MAQTTTNYGLLKPESTDSYNHLIYDNPNMDTIDAAMKANADAAITAATCIKSGTTHTITRSNTDAPVMRFTATGDWNSGDTMIIDGVTVTPYLANGDALIDKSYLINTEVLLSLSGTRATVYTNANIASNIEYSSGVTVAQAITAAATATGTSYGLTDVATQLNGLFGGKKVAIECVNNATAGVTWSNYHVSIPTQHQIYYTTNIRPCFAIRVGGSENFDWFIKSCAPSASQELDVWVNGRETAPASFMICIMYLYE